MLKIDREKCTNCGACRDVCAAMVIEEIDGAAVPVHIGACIKCWHCVAVCPADAVTCDRYTLDEFKKVSACKPVATPAAVRNLLLTRRSVREFKNKEVPRELLEEMIAIASQSPTGHNAQAVKLNIVTDKKLMEKLDRRILKIFDGIVAATAGPVSDTILKSVGAGQFAGILIEQKETFERFKKAEGDKSQHVFRGAPVLVVAHHGLDAMAGREDCVIAMRDLMLLAEAHGLGCTWIGYIVAAARIDPSIKKSLGVPLGNKLAAAAIIGWPRRKYKRIIPRKPISVTWIE